MSVQCLNSILANKQINGLTKRRRDDRTDDGSMILLILIGLWGMVDIIIGLLNSAAEFVCFIIYAQLRTTLRPNQLNKCKSGKIRFNPMKSSFKTRRTCNSSLLGKT